MKTWFKRNKNAILGATAIAIMLFAMSLEEPIPEPTEIETEQDIIRWKDESTKSFEEVTIEEVKTVTVEEPTEPTEEEPALVSLGEFKLTAYCSCEKCCGKWAENRPVDEHGNEIVIGSEGTRLEPLRSVAVDTDVIPYGTEIKIYDKVFIAQDTGGSVKGNHIDIYFGSHEETIAFGVQYTEVFMVGGVEDVD